MNQNQKPSTPAREVHAFECNVRGRQWQKIVNHRTRSKARYAYLLDVRDAWPDTTFADIVVRKVGPPSTSEAFRRTAKYRGLLELQCGHRVACGNATGTIVAHNSSANFDVLFDDDSPEFAGLTLNVHPMEMRILA